MDRGQCFVHHHLLHVPNSPISDITALVALGTYVWSGAGNGVDSYKSHDFEATCSQITSSGGSLSSLSLVWSVNQPIAWESSRHFVMLPLWFPWAMTAEIPCWWCVTRRRRRRILYLGTCRLEAKKLVKSSHHYPDLGSDALSVWNFCAHFSDVISQRNHSGSIAKC